MRTGFTFRLRTIQRLTILCIALSCRQLSAQYTEIDIDLNIGGVQAGVEVLTRGPVHEAFAETVTFDPRPAVVIPRAPGELIEEVPPDQRPEGAHVAWISGYWGWDDERRDYLWISGVWRSVPPGRQWVAGYWRPVGGGVQWVSGYWADADIEEIEYLPEPPDMIEEVVVHAPSPDYTWFPGVWVWQRTGYVWRPGYWSELRTDWVWVPAHYAWCPRGYVFVDGYWDHVIGQRGVLFAPVYFEATAATTRVSNYSPKVAINLDLFTDHLFVRPQCHHYYFGDYYAAKYQDVGFYPSFTFQARRYGYDPIYAHLRWDHRHESDWERRVESAYVYRRDHESARPPRTLSAAIELRSRGAAPEGRSLVLATSIEGMAKRQTGAVRFKRVDADEQKSIVARTQATRKSREARYDMEAKDARPALEKSVERAEPVRAIRPKSPILAIPSREDGSKAPPQKQAAPQPDPTVRPKPKKAQVEVPKNDTDAGKSKAKGKSKTKNKDD